VNRRNPHPLKNCLDNFTKSWGDLDKLSKINENWKNLIGLELFQECKPLNIEKKILTIAVNHPQWRQALIYNKHKLKERIEKIGITLNEIKIIQNYEIKNKNIKATNAKIVWAIIQAESIKIICVFVLFVIPLLLRAKSKDGESVLFVGEK